MVELSRKGCLRKVLQDHTSMTTSIEIAEKVGEVGLQKFVNDEDKISKVKVKECNSLIAVKVNVLKHGRKMRDLE